MKLGYKISPYTPIFKISLEERLIISPYFYAALRSAFARNASTNYNQMSRYCNRADCNDRTKERKRGRECDGIYSTG